MHCRSVRICIAGISIVIAVTVIQLLPIGTAQESPPNDQDEAAAQRKILDRFHGDKLAPKDFEKLSAKEIEVEIESMQQGRRASLQRRILAVTAEYNAGLRESTAGTVLLAHADLAEFELESAASPAARIRALQTITRAAHHLELEVREKAEFGAIGGSQSALMEAMASRLKWEQRLAREILAMKQPAKSK